MDAQRLCGSKKRGKGAGREANELIFSQVCARASLVRTVLSRSCALFLVAQSHIHSTRRHAPQSMFYYRVDARFAYAHACAYVRARAHTHTHTGLQVSNDSPHTVIAVNDLVDENFVRHDQPGEPHQCVWARACLSMCSFLSLSHIPRSHVCLVYATLTQNIHMP